MGSGYRHAESFGHAFHLWKTWGGTGQWMVRAYRWLADVRSGDVRRFDR
jgi:hypothetical protein